ncbi:hypothetical protein U9M48_006196 [Paspalum notatum var. saurae]|uniref:Uncharacterized protein n=1 Tax=Paspalum notatum var. saurae TaxID=547442 RepID=A0AAQ3SG06_PASNO
MIVDLRLGHPIKCSDGMQDFTDGDKVRSKMFSFKLAELNFWCMRMRGPTSYSLPFAAEGHVLRTLNKVAYYCNWGVAWLTDLKENTQQDGHLLQQTVRFFGHTVRYSIISPGDFGHSKDTTDSNGERAPDFFFACTL